MESLVGLMSQWLPKAVMEMKKHAERDKCHDCTQLLKNPLIMLYIEALEKVNHAQ
jgi:hypothetical protein